MDPVSGGLLGIGIDSAFDILNTFSAGMMGYASNKKLMKKQFEYQKELQRIQNDYNVYNFQHQHQWRVADLRSAGLNPILSANGGTSVAPASAGSVGLASAGFHPSNSDRLTRVLMQDALLTSSAKAKSEIEFNKASAAERASAAVLNTARAKFEEQKGNAARDVRSFYDQIKGFSDSLGKSISDRILNNAFFERAVNFTGLPLTPDPKAWDDWRKAQIRKARTTYDPERKVFIHHGGN